MHRYVTTWHYNIKLSVDKIIIIIEIITIIINKKWKICSNVLFIYMSVWCLYGVSAVFSMTFLKLCT